jgi:acyl-CoA synthetase (NDP forming)
MSFEKMDKIFNPKSIAVVGTSANPQSMGHWFFASLLEFGYQGKVFPINLKQKEILGVKAYPSIQDVPGDVDYVISCIPATRILELMDGCVGKGVNAIHMFTARFSETGRKDAAELEQEVLRRAKAANIRIIGPNCMGMYHGKIGIAFTDALPHQYGSVGLITQSGQMAEEVARYGALRNVFFSKIISYGNALDLNETDFLDYYTEDPNTKIILMYIEGVRAGRNFFRALQQAAAKKPVIILKGGRGESGSRAASSHTASMAGSEAVLESLVPQAGAVWADDFNGLIDLAVAFSFLPPIKGNNVGIAGGGGGTSVLAADMCEASGLNVIQIPDEMRQELKSEGSTIWDWIGNPVDMSIRDSADFVPGVMLQKMGHHPDFDFLMALMNDPHHERQKGMKVEGYLKQFHIDALNGKPLLAIVPDKSIGAGEADHWSWKVLCEIRSAVMEAGMPVYPTVKRAAVAADKLAAYYRHHDNN